MTHLLPIVAALLLPGVARADVPVTTEVRVVRRVNPSFPSAARQPAARCVVTVEVDAEGRAQETRAYGCPEPFATTATTAVSRWRWARPEVDGAPAAGRTIVSVLMAELGAPMPAAPARCDHRVEVAPDGAITPAAADPTSACVTVFPSHTEPPPVGVSCSAEPGKDGASPSLHGCPAPARDWLESLLASAEFAPAGATTVWIEAAPAAM